VMYPAIAAPLPIREREVAVEGTAGVAHPGRREESIDDHQVLASPQALVLQLSPELAHRGVREALGQLGSHQPFETQILDADPVVILDQLSAQFVKEVAPLVGGSPVDLGDGNAGPGFAVAPGLASGELPLGSLEFPLPFAEELGGRDRVRPVGEGREVDQPQVDADSLFGHRQGNVGHLELGRQGDVPVAQGVPLERGGFRRQVHIYRLEDPDLADLGDDDAGAFDLDPLGDAESERIAFPALEPGIASPLLEEITERSVQVLQGLLQGLRVGFLEPCRLGLPLEGRQFGRELLEADRLAVGLEVVPPSPQAPVPHPSAGTGQAVQDRLLSPGRTHPEAEGFAVGGHGSNSLLVFDVLLDDSQWRTAHRAHEIRVSPERRESAPELRKIPPEQPRGSALDCLDELVDSELRINLDEQVDVVWHDLDLDQFGFGLRHDFGDDCLEPGVDLIDQDGATKLRTPDDVVLAGVDDVSIALVSHALIIQHQAIESIERSGK
jgi:hypothetical protein